MKTVFGVRFWPGAFSERYSGFRDSMVYLGRNRNDLDFYFSDFTMYFMLLGDPELSIFENFESPISNQNQNLVQRGINISNYINSFCRLPKNTPKKLKIKYISLGVSEVKSAHQSPSKCARVKIFGLAHHIQPLLRQCAPWRINPLRPRCLAC